LSGQGRPANSANSPANVADQANVRNAALMWINFIYIQAARLEEAVNTTTEIVLHRSTPPPCASTSAGHH
jgi:hypothetical protein